jgi:hypothetical protein
MQEEAVVYDPDIIGLMNSGAGFLAIIAVVNLLLSLLVSLLIQIC